MYELYFHTNTNFRKIIDAQKHKTKFSSLPDQCLRCQTLEHNYIQIENVFILPIPVASKWSSSLFHGNQLPRGKQAFV